MLIIKSKQTLLAAAVAARATTQALRASLIAIRHTNAYTSRGESTDGSWHLWLGRNYHELAIVGCLFIDIQKNGITFV